MTHFGHQANTLVEIYIYQLTYTTTTVKEAFLIDHIAPFMHFLLLIGLIGNFLKSQGS